MNLTLLQNRKPNKTWSTLVLAMIFVFLCSVNLSAHDFGTSSISLEIADGKLIIYSSYARADFDAVIKFNDAEDFSSLHSA